MTRLEQLIEEHNLVSEDRLTIQIMADRAGIPDRTVYRHIRGETRPNLQQAAAYARVLGRRLEDLVEDAA